MRLSIGPSQIVEQSSPRGRPDVRTPISSQNTQSTEFFLFSLQTLSTVRPRLAVPPDKYPEIIPFVIP